MRGEEVSREIPFIFSRAFADTRPRSAWGERGRFLSAAGKEANPGILLQGRMLVPSWRRLNRHVGWAVRRWAGQVTAATHGMADGFGAAQRSLGPATSEGAKGHPPHPSVSMAHRYQLSVLVGQPSRHRYRSLSQCHPREL